MLISMLFYKDYRLVKKIDNGARLKSLKLGPINWSDDEMINYMKYHPSIEVMGVERLGQAKLIKMNANGSLDHHKYIMLVIIKR